MRSPNLSRAGWIVAILAVVLATGGTAVAAKKYVLTSTSQISPKVRKALKGAKGPKGAAGVAGTAGAIGPAGAAGPVGPAGAKGEAGARGETGARGAAGAPGATGDRGPQGDPGPSRSVTFFHDDTVSIDGTAPQQVMAVVAPAAGSWLIRFKGEVNVGSAIGGNTARAECTLFTNSTPGASDGSSIGTVQPATPANSFSTSGTIGMQLSATMTATNAAAVVCNRVGTTGGAGIKNLKLSFLRVGEETSVAVG